MDNPGIASTKGVRRTTLYCMSTYMKPPIRPLHRFKNYTETFYTIMAYETKYHCISFHSVPFDSIRSTYVQVVITFAFVFADS